AKAQRRRECFGTDEASRMARHSAFRPPRESAPARPPPLPPHPSFRDGDLHAPEISLPIQSSIPRRVRFVPSPLGSPHAGLADVLWPASRSSRLDVARHERLYW